MLTHLVYNTSPHTRTPLAASEADRAPLAFHQKLPGYAPTPLQEAPALAAELGIGHVWVKYEASRMGLPAYKILGASWATYVTLCERLSTPPQPWQTLEELSEQFDELRPLTLAAATDGNHGRAVARVAALLGFGAHIFVPQGTAIARIRAIEGEGATATVVDGSYDDAVAVAAAHAGRHCAVIADTSWEGYVEVPRRVIDGYATLFWEIEDELARQGTAQPDLVLVQTGVGALAAAAVRAFRRPDLHTLPCLVSIEPDSAACVLESIAAGQITTVPGPHPSIMVGLNCGTPSAVAWPFMQQRIDAFAAIDDEAAIAAMRALAGAGIVAGETGAAGYAGLAALLTGPGAAERRARLGVHAQTSALVIVTEGITDPIMYEQLVGQVSQDS